MCYNMMTSSERNDLRLQMEKVADRAVREGAWEAAAQFYASLLGQELQAYSVRPGLGGGTPRLVVQLHPVGPIDVSIETHRP